MSDYSHKLINPRDVEPNATLRHFYTSNNFGAAEMELCLMDGSSYHITASELYTALQIFTCDYFGSMVEAHNKAEDYEELVNLAYTEALDGDKNGVYDLYHNSKMVGRYRERAQQLKARIQERVSFDAWVAACKLYETMYQIPREWI